MERKQIANVVVPALAVAALIGLVALVLVSGGGSGGKGGGGAAADATPAGMSDARPPLDAPEWKDIGSGLKIWDAVEGAGSAVNSPSQQVTVHYTGWLTSGVEFDTSKKGAGKPISFGLNGVIPGWTRGIPGMKPGGIRRLYIPWDLAYGEQGSPPKIGPKADLVFEVKLISSP